MCTDEPPDAFLAGARGEVRLDKGGSCWRRPPNAQGLVIGRCVDNVATEPTATLVVTRGETLTLRFSSMAPTEVELTSNEVPMPLTAGNPVRFAADFPVGVHVVGFFTVWFQGDASYGVRLDVRAPAAPAPAPRGIALTG